MPGSESLGYSSHPSRRLQSITLSTRNDVYAGWSDKVELASREEVHLDDRSFIKQTFPRPVHRQEADPIG